MSGKRAYYPSFVLQEGDWCGPITGYSENGDTADCFVFWLPGEEQPRSVSINAEGDVSFGIRDLRGEFQPV